MREPSEEKDFELAVFLHGLLAAGWVPPEEAEALRFRADEAEKGRDYWQDRTVRYLARVRELEASWVRPERVEEIDCPLEVWSIPDHPHESDCVCGGGGKLRIVRETT